MTTVFGYRHVDIPRKFWCPCGDPGNYLMMETVDGKDVLRCWCGNTSTVTFDSDEERAEFIRDAKAAKR